MRHRVAARVPLAEVHAALATADDIARWWTTVTIGDGALGGLLVTRFADPDGVEIGGFDLRVTALEPTRIQWQVVDGPPEWIGTRLTFDLATEVDGAGTSWTVVLFTHTGWREPGDFMSHCSTKWATFLLSLRDLVETGSGRPAPDDVRIGDWH
ncbi:MAG: polyketide cyclase [Nocardioides sp.]|nr:polyketide cyclase [Nocardioides sp.]